MDDWRALEAESERLTRLIEGLGAAAWGYLALERVAAQPSRVTILAQTVPRRGPPQS